MSSALTPSALPKPKFEVLAEVENLIGESPVYSLDGASIYWVDICKPSIFAFQLISSEISIFPQEEMVTAISDTEQGLLAATQSGIKLIDLTAGQVHKTICDPEGDLPTNR